MDRQKFFDAVRSRPFGGRLSQQNVDGLTAILDEWRALYPDGDVHHLANILAQIYHETATRMVGIKETVMPHHTNTTPSDDEVIRRLDRAFARGQLPWVRAPYWREGWFGRGHVQLTHRSNYEKMGKRLGVDLVANRDLALDNHISARIAIVGMMEGLFTGRKLSDYTFPRALDAGSGQHPRRIVNGHDGTDADIARLHRQFHAALDAAGYKPGQPAPAPSPPDVEPVPNNPEIPDGSRDAAAFWAALFEWLRKWFGGKA